MSNTSSGPSRNKRPRTSLLTGTLRRSEHLWYDDGNVVLVAENVAFKVHRSILSNCSDVFRDMFELAQLGTSSIFDGTPTVELSDDAGDLVHILNVLYSHGREYVPLCVDR